MTRRSNTTAVAALILCVLWLAGCSSDDTTEPVPTPSLVEEGWEAYEGGDFTAAASKFQAAIAEDASNADARNGLGWASAKLGDYPDAVVRFDEALTRGFSGPDPHAGRAVVLRDLEPVVYPDAIAAANAALTIDPDFQFAHEPALDWKDLRLILAQSHFAIGEYDLANAQVDLLGGTAQDSSSATYVSNLLAEIERLGDLIGN